jgi:hypothetical protein
MAGLLDFDFDLNDPKTMGLLNLGLGILAGNTGRPGDMGAGLAQGLGNYQQMIQAQQRQKMLDEQFGMQRKQFEWQQAEQERKVAEEASKKAAMSRLFGGQGGYQSMQDVPVERTENVPAAPFANAPNFGLTQNAYTENVKQPVFDRGGMMRDLMDAGYGGELIKQQFFREPGKIEYLDVGDRKLAVRDGAVVAEFPIGISQKDLKGWEIDLYKHNAPSGSSLLSAQTQRSEGALNRGVSIRGQNLTDERAKEANSVGRVPTGYSRNPDGTLSPIQGGPADKKKNPTEAQGKANLYASRADEADVIINSLKDDYSSLALNTKLGAENMWGIGGLVSPIANTLLPANEQKVEQAQRNFINAILRQESGAVITDSEFANAAKQYFPQPGDSKEVLKQKATNRRTAISGLRTMAGDIPSSGATGGWGGDGGAGFSVTAPDGKTYTFPDQKSLNNFKMKAGIR